MSTEIKLDGLAEMMQAFKDASAQTRAKIEDAVTVTAVNVQAKAIRRIQSGPATGRVYKSKVSGRSHQASAPGESPMSDSGALASSIYRDQEGTTAYVGSPLVYSVYLEFGTSKMKPRPFLFPSLESERADFHRRLKGVLA